MKRKPFWALFTAILLLTTLFPSTALADYTYDGSIDCTSGTVTGGEGWRWDAGSSTLTIEANTTITVPAGSSYGINLPADAKLQPNGLVTIQADGSSGTFTGVQFMGDGEINSGSLTVTGGSSAVSVNGDLTLKGVIIAGTGTGIAFSTADPTLNVSLDGFLPARIPLSLISNTKKHPKGAFFRLSKKWLAPLFRGVHSSLAPTARSGSYARKPLLRKAFCGFDAHVAKSDQSLRGLRPPNPRGFFDRLKKSTPRVLFCFGGERGIRTLDTLMRYTRFPVVRLRPARPSLQMGEGQKRFTQL